MNQLGSKPAPIAAIILAAGLSRRMGAFKPLLDLGGKPMLLRTVETLTAVPNLKPLLVITGHNAQQVRTLLQDFPVLCVHNESYATGEMLSSVQAGLRAIPPDAAAVVLALGDQPAVQPQTVKKLLDAWRGGQTVAPVVLPIYGEKRGHPLLLSLTLREEILNLHSANDSLKTIINRHQAHVLQVPVDDPAILADIDTPEDYRQAQKQWQERHSPTKHET